jgi:hypothetical protein
MYKKIIYILSLIFFIVSCNSFDSVKRGITGEKRQGGDEFLIKKKDPLILPPDFENLPTPDEQITSMEEISTIEKTLETAVEETSPTSSSVEELIIKKIQKR